LRRIEKGLVFAIWVGAVPAIIGMCALDCRVEPGTELFRGTNLLDQNNSGLALGKSSFGSKGIHILTLTTSVPIEASSRLNRRSTAASLLPVLGYCKKAIWSYGIISRNSYMMTYVCKCAGAGGRVQASSFIANKYIQEYKKRRTVNKA
jgi:hypothetical protein